MVFILASTSPRRKMLLEREGLDFRVETSQAEELHSDSIGLVELCELNARLKGGEVAARFPDHVIVASDTMVGIDDRRLGKPVDLDDAKATLQMLSGRINTVCSSVYLSWPGGEECFSSEAKVIFRELSEEIIDEYVSKVDVLDKAGSYAVQECGELIIESVDGDMDTVIGLPVQLLLERMRGNGLL